MAKSTMKINRDEKARTTFGPHGWNAVHGRLIGPMRELVPEDGIDDEVLYVAIREKLTAHHTRWFTMNDLRQTCFSMRFPLKNGIVFPTDLPVQ